LLGTKFVHVCNAKITGILLKCDFANHNLGKVNIFKFEGSEKIMQTNIGKKILIKVNPEY